MSGSSRWYFTEEQLSNSPSRKCGMNSDLELSHRQRAANLIQEMGQRLQVSQLCINTGIVYMHRFYAFHSFSMFHRNSIAAAAFFLAAKVEEQPRKLEHVIKILNITLEKNDVGREAMTEMTQELVFHENVLLQTLGFDVAIDHPHTHVVRACQLFNIVEVSKELRQTCYFMASNSLHLTTMCLKYKPTVVAAFCIYLACRWARWEIPNSSEGKPWYSYVDETVTLDTLKKLTDEYLQILERSPSKFKNKMKSITNGQGINQGTSRDEPSTSTQSSRHEASSSRHHHQSRSSSSNSSSSNMSNRKTEVPAQKQPPIMPHSSSSYKNQQMHQTSQPPPVSTSLQRQNNSSSTTTSSRTAYPSDSNNTSNQKPDRTHQDSSSYSNISRTLDPVKQQQSSRMSLSQASTTAINPLSSSQQPQAPSSSHMKPSNHDQRHSLGNPKPPVDYQQQQSKKQTSAVDYPNRSSSNSSSLASSSHLQQPPQQQPQLSGSMILKKSAWPQQSQMSQPKSQNTLAASHSHPNLNALHLSSNNMHRSSSQSLFLDQQSANKTLQSSQPTLSNDMPWFSDTKTPEALQNHPQSITHKNPTPPKQGKSMFSPSPEHEHFDRAKLMMMSSTNVKRERERESPKNEKSDRRPPTPSKKAKQRVTDNTLGLGIKTQSQSAANMQDQNRHFSVPLPTLIPDSKKRPYSSDMDSHHDISRDNVKSRKVDQKQLDFSLIINKAQPIETNPDAVKSLLQECFKQEVSKFDINGDSPLDVLTPTDPNAGSLANLLTNPVSLSTTLVTQSAAIPSPLISSHHLQQHPALIDHLPPKVEPIDNGTSDEYSSSHKKHSKSKKKKDKHKKKKKHKSDREDRDEEEKRDREAGPLKIVLAKDKSDSNQLNPPSLKIKIPINNSIDFRNNQQVQPQPIQPAPIKLKISKDKIGGFNNSFADAGRDVSGDGMSSSSSSHKKHKDKDKDRDRHSRKSKHNNNNSDGYHMPHQQQQQHYSIGKMDEQSFMMQPQIPTSFNFQQQLPPQQFDGSTPEMQQMFNNPALLRQHQLMQMQMQNYLYQNSSNG